MQSIREDGGGMAIGKIEELEWDTFLVGCYAKG
jgi:hypothetical protein